MNLSEKNVSIIIKILVFCLCMGVVIWGYTGRKKLKERHLITTARIDGCSKGSIGNAGSRFIEFTFHVHQDKYSLSSTYLTSQITESDCNNFFVGKIFPVVYSPVNPSNASILITPKDFERYGYPFPDSLKWVLQYFKEE